MENQTSLSDWYVVHTKPHKEAVAEENLKRQGYSTYCPQIAQACYRRKRWQQVVSPLFPRYLFIKLNPGVDNFSPVRSTIGVQKLVAFGGHPAWVPQQTINLIKQQEAQALEDQSPCPKWLPGDEVEVVEGPFSGLKGIFDMQSGDDRVMILFQLLGQDNRVALPVHSIIPA